MREGSRMLINCIAQEAIRGAEFWYIILVVMSGIS